jgi:hypothetical protein
VGFLREWELTYDELDEIVTENPSLQSFIVGYAAEVKCRDVILRPHPDVSNIYKPDDHDRTEKGDLIATYKDERMAVEVKSLQGSSLKQRRSGLVIPTYQCDASDNRMVTFTDGTSVQTTALLVGEFDVVAINLRALTGRWDFVFCKNEDLPRMDGRRGKSKEYTQFQLDNLIKTIITLPLTEDYKAVPPYRDEPFSLFDEIIEERRRDAQPRLEAMEIDHQRPDRQEGKE